MYLEMMAVIFLIHNAVVSKRHIADHHIKEIIGVGCLFKTINGNRCFLVKLFGNKPGDAIQLHTVQSAVLHFLRQHTEEIADTHGRLQNISALKSHLRQGIIHGFAL